MIEIIFHIGMGKTGTSSIQQTLSTSLNQLDQHATGYLGMWFDQIDHSFWGLSGFDAFLQSSPQEKIDFAQRFVEVVTEDATRNGHKRVILSNEMICENIAHLLPFFQSLQPLCDLKIIGYLRPVSDWLPSAYQQWYVHHKTVPGPIRSFAEATPDLIERYRSVLVWQEHFSDIITWRAFSSGTDVVEDFFNVIGVDRGNPEGLAPLRKQARLPADQILLRAMFNNQFETPVYPARFNTACGNFHLDLALRLEALIEGSFTYDQAPQIVEERAATFEKITKGCNLDLLAGDPNIPAPPDLPALRERLLEQTMALTLSQGDRLHQLEQKAKLLEDRLH